MLIFLLLGALILILVYNFIKVYNHYTKLGIKQPKRPWPIFGDAWRTTFRIMSFGDFVYWIYNVYDKCRYLGFFQLSFPTFVVKDPDLIKDIAIKNFDHFTDHLAIINSDEEIFGKNLLFMKGNDWKEMRSLLSRAFTSSKMKHMFEVINETAETFTSHFARKNENIIEVEMKSVYTSFTNDVIATTAFGVQVDSLKQPDNTFYTLGRKLTALGGTWAAIKLTLLLISPKMCKFFRITFFDQKLVNYFKNIILETIKIREENHVVRKDMIDILLQTRQTNKSEESDSINPRSEEPSVLEKFKFKKSKTLTNDDIVAQALIFFFAGFEPISTALAYGSHELARNKDVQDKLREEIRQTHKLNNGNLTYETLQSMKYMDMTFSEIVRKWPPALVLDRVCTKPFTIKPKYADEKPVELKTGDVIWIPVYGFHRDPKYYPNPEKFDPERFSDENKAQINPYAYLPFGVGPRNCIASRLAILESKTLFYYLLLNFEIVPIAKTAKHLEFTKTTMQNTVKGGYWLGLKRI